MRSQSNQRCKNRSHYCHSLLVPQHLEQGLAMVISICRVVALTPRSTKQKFIQTKTHAHLRDSGDRGNRQREVAPMCQALSDAPHL